jgi:hypothetical protein
VAEIPLFGERVIFASEKLAVTYLSEFIVIVIGFVLPEASPLQWSNTQPFSGVAVSVAALPDSYVPAPETEPDPTGIMEVERVYCTVGVDEVVVVVVVVVGVVVMAEKFAVSVVSESMVTDVEAEEPV